jgi:hypothetical protein
VRGARGGRGAGRGRGREEVVVGGSRRAGGAGLEPRPFFFAVAGDRAGVLRSVCACERGVRPTGRSSALVGLGWAGGRGGVVRPAGGEGGRRVSGVCGPRRAERPQTAFSLAQPPRRQNRGRPFQRPPPARTRAEGAHTQLPGLRRGREGWAVGSWRVNWILVGVEGRQARPPLPLPSLPFVQRSMWTPCALKIQSTLGLQAPEKAGHPPTRAGWEGGCRMGGVVGEAVNEESRPAQTDARPGTCRARPFAVKGASPTACRPFSAHTPHTLASSYPHAPPSLICAPRPPLLQLLQLIMDLRTQGSGVWVRAAQPGDGFSQRPLAHNAEL